MKRPKKFTVNPDSYLATDIDPLLDELEALRGYEKFPTLQEFAKWTGFCERNVGDIYDYFKAFKTIEVMPEVGREYEFKNGNFWCRKVFDGFMSTDEWICKTIRPISTPNRDEVIAKAKELGLTDSELEVLCNTK